jgi:probable HAF family extracellular repeat protein
VLLLRRGAPSFRALLALTLLAVFGPTPARAQQIIEIDASALGGSRARPFDVNSLGQVVGSYTASNGISHAFFWENGVMTDIESDPNARSFSLAINDNGLVVGQTERADGVTIAFRWIAPGPMERLTIFNGEWAAGRESVATDVNNSDIIVGYARARTVLGLVDTAYRLDPPPAARGLRMSTLGGVIGRAFAISVLGEIVGQSEAFIGVTRATRWSSDFIPVPTQLDTATSSGTDVNETGDIVGWQFTGRDDVPRLWNLNGGVVETSLDLLPGDSGGRARAVRKRAARDLEIVGNSGSRAVRWRVDNQGGVAVEDLNDELPAGSGWVLTSASGMNDQGQIVGTGTLGGEDGHGYLFDPQTPPTAPPAILFVHGILASHLYFGCAGDEIWPPLPVTTDILRMELGSDENPIVTAHPRPEDVLLETAKQPVLKKFIPYLDVLKTLGVIGDWHAYAYDWRYEWPRIVDEGAVYDPRCFDLTAVSTFDPKTCEECRQIEPSGTACLRLEDKIAELAGESGGPRRKVWIVAHSYGGLVTKTLLQRLPNVRDHLAGIILVASPQLGTPQTFLSMLHGYGDPLLSYLPSVLENPVRQASRVSGRTWPMSYHLLPSREYFNRVLQPVFEFNSIGEKGGMHPSATAWFNRYRGLIADYAGMQDFLIPGNPTRPRPPSAAVNVPDVVDGVKFFVAEIHHLDILPVGPDSFAERLPFYQVVGVGLPTARGIGYFPSKKDTLEHRGLYTCDGDGTVVAPSASAVSDATTFYLDLPAHNNARRQGLLTSNSRHRDILGVESVQDLITRIITGVDTSTIPFISSTKPTTACRGARLRTRSPVEVHAFQDGRHTGPQSGPPLDPDAVPIETEIPNSDYIAIGEGRELFVDDVGLYDVLLEGVGIGTVTLEGSRFVGDDVEPRLLVEDIPVLPGSTVSFILDPALEPPPDLTVDLDGDGVGDFVLESGTSPSPELFLAGIESALLLLRDDTAAADLPRITDFLVRRIVLRAAFRLVEAAEKAVERGFERKAGHALELARWVLDRYVRTLDHAVARGRVSAETVEPLISAANDTKSLIEVAISQLD